MNIYILLAGVLLAVGLLAYYLSDTVRSWVSSAWHRWFKDSEVNITADFMFVLGFIGTLVSDPAFADLWGKVGVEPGTLMAIAGAVRILRMLRDRSMVPMTKD